MERVRREFLCNSTQALKMESGFDATNERECSICLFDLHLSAAGCHYCSPDKYACLNHAKQLCSCSWGAKFFLFRYDINELNILVEALEGKLSAIYRWARLDLGLALSSHVSKENSRYPELIGKLSYSPEESSQPSTSSLKKQNGKESIAKIPNSEDMKTSSTSHISSHEAEVEIYSFQCKKEESLNFAPDLKAPVCQLSQEDTSFNDNLVAEKPEVKKPSIFSNDAVIVLSDDETEESNVPLPQSTRNALSKHTGDFQMAGSDDMVGLGNCVPKDSVLVIPITRATTMLEVDAKLDCAKAEDHVKTETLVGSNKEKLSCQTVISSGGNLDNNVQVLSSIKESGNCNIVSGKLNNEDRENKTGLEAISRVTDNVQTLSGSPSCTQNILDRYYRQKGPRIAKVVRRINCQVEPLEFGVVHSGKLWCDSRAIYPKGMMHYLFIKFVFS